MSFDTETGPVHVTLSLGAAILREECDDLDALLECADEALLSAKRAGRNRVAVWSRNSKFDPCEGL